MAHALNESQNEAPSRSWEVAAATAAATELLRITESSNQPITSRIRRKVIGSPTNRRSSHVLRTASPVTDRA